MQGIQPKKQQQRQSTDVCNFSSVISVLSNENIISIQWKFYVDLGYSQCSDKNQSWLFTMNLDVIRNSVGFFCWSTLWVSCIAINCLFTMSLHEHMWRQKKHGVKTFDCSHCVKKFGLFLWQEFLNLHEDTKGMVSKLLIALIVIRNLAFFDRNFWHRHKKYGAKSANCS